jgi:cytochrome c553
MKIRILPAMVLLPLVTGAPIIAAQTINQGLQVFASHCASCHGSDGNGGELGPEISSLVPNRSDEELHNLFMQGLPNAGMPAFVNLPEAETVPLIAFLRTLKPRFGSGPARGVAQVGNQTIEGLVLNQGHEDMQLLDDDRRVTTGGQPPRRLTGPVITATTTVAATAPWNKSITAILQT